MKFTITAATGKENGRGREKRVRRGERARDGGATRGWARPPELGLAQAHAAERLAGRALFLDRFSARADRHTRLAGLIKLAAPPLALANPPK